MPELPEVETVRAGLTPFLEGAVIRAVTLNRPDLRFPFPQHFAHRLEGQTIGLPRRRAKYLLFPLSSGETWLTHLGMTGSFLTAAIDLDIARYHPPAGAHRHVEMVLEHPAHGMVSLAYSDPRRFGYMDLLDDPETSRHLKNLGPEPLGNALSAPHLALRFAGRRTPIKAALLDQRHIAGLGNIYVCEALWRAGIDPRRQAHTLVTKAGQPRLALERLVTAIREVIGEAIVAGGSTLRDFRHADGELGYFQHSFSVYDREGEPCRREGCGGTIRRIVQSGRSTFYCPRCQK
ncbi:bifunctional DNA-formamidopyrimidine glycosylase/DNA-(apurinic or apyrimidinic site) lyase [Cucumibacter marinus]|uniref:bifunctional DNA-formamidopyrimidine glycosylase/DNA-(apurinic or apyrimidinic site) lyase n=1 Tax=Cucumibacter marinus TaxID=1121252 RepID=UPI00041CEB1C|nr:bifunctional DNA-formamidopyrimidine glycosylase/DNA-(apurinic or apyrimidinic site) lyase [Cucumibacter marinus]